MDYTQKASLSKYQRTKSMLTICIVGTVSLVGLVLGVLAFIKVDILFGILYLLAFLFGMSYVVIRINAVVPSFLAIDGNLLVLQNWENGIFPFNIAFKPAFFCDFVPAKTKLYHIDIAKITKLMIGTKSFLARNLSNPRFAEDMHAMIEINPRCEKLLQKLDILYIETIDQAVYYMSVDQFDSSDLAGVLRELGQYTPDLAIRCSNPDIRRRL